VTVLAELPTPGGALVVRRATAHDLPALVRLLADDQLGATRDGPDDDAGLEPYRRAFAALDADPAHLLVVAAPRDGDAREVLATLQLSFLPGLARRGALRAQVEAVRVAAAHRSGGAGTALLTWAVDEARRRGCALVQLTTDARRAGAHRFYERLGFVPSHVGFKLLL